MTSSKFPHACPTAVLSQREREVLYLVAQGLFSKEIARRLGLSTRTIDRHLASIFKKLNVNSRTQAVCKALRQGVLSWQAIAESE